MCTCVVAPVIMATRETPILSLGSGNLAYTYPVVSYEKIELIWYCSCYVAYVVCLIVRSSVHLHGNYTRCQCYGRFAV